VNRPLGDTLGPRRYVRPVGQGDSDKPRDHAYSTVERARYATRAAISEHPELLAAAIRRVDDRRGVPGPVTTHR